MLTWPYAVCCFKLEGNKKNYATKDLIDLSQRSCTDQRTTLQLQVFNIHMMKFIQHRMNMTMIGGRGRGRDLVSASTIRPIYVGRHCMEGSNCS